MITYNIMTNRSPRSCRYHCSPNVMRMNVDEVKQIIQLMATKSCELDPIPTMVLKRLLKDLTPIITRIVNISLQIGTFTTAWKTSTSTEGWTRSYTGQL